MLFPMTRWAFLTVTLVWLGMVTPAAADDIADCSQSANDDLRIRGCTSLIQQGSADAVSYYGRGLALSDIPHMNPGFWRHSSAHGRPRQF